jgi:hypothetical protein
MNVWFDHLLLLGWFQSVGSRLTILIALFLFSIWCSNQDIPIPWWSWSITIASCANAIWRSGVAASSLSSVHLHQTVKAPRVVRTRWYPARCCGIFYLKNIMLIEK